MPIGIMTSTSRENYQNTPNHRSMTPDIGALWEATRKSACQDGRVAGDILEVLGHKI